MGEGEAQGEGWTEVGETHGGHLTEVVTAHAGRVVGRGWVDGRERGRPRGEGGGKGAPVGSGPQPAQGGGDDAPPRAEVHVGKVAVDGPAHAHLAQRDDDAGAPDEVHRVEDAAHPPQELLFRRQELVWRRGRRQRVVKRCGEDRRCVRDIVRRCCVGAGDAHGGRALNVVGTSVSSYVIVVIVVACVGQTTIA